MAEQLPEYKRELPEYKRELPEYKRELPEYKSRELPAYKKELPAYKRDLPEYKKELPKFKKGRTLKSIRRTPSEELFPDRRSAVGAQKDRATTLTFDASRARGESYPAIIGKSLTKGVVTAAPRAFLAAEDVKKRAISDVKKVGGAFVPRASGTPEERAQAIATITGKPYVAPTKAAPGYEPEDKIAPVISKGVALADKYLTPDTGESRTKQLVSQASESVGNIVGTGFNLPAIAAKAGFEKTQEALKEGVSLPRSLVAGTVTGLTEYFTEKIPLEILKKPGTPYLRRLISGLKADAPGEVIATLTEMGVVDENILNKDYTWADYKRAVIDTLIVSGLMTGGLTTITQPFVGGKAQTTQQTDGTLPPSTLPPTVQTQEPSVEQQNERAATKAEILKVEQKLTELPRTSENVGKRKTLERYRRFLTKKSLHQGEFALPVRAKPFESDTAIPSSNQVAAKHQATLDKSKQELDRVKKRKSRLTDSPGDALKKTHLDREQRYLERVIPIQEQIVVDTTAPTEEVPVERTSAAEQVPTADTSVVSGVLPVNREGERGAITLRQEDGKTVKETSTIRRGINSIMEFWRPLSTIPESKEFHAKRNRLAGKLFRIEEIVGKIRKKAETLSPEGRYKGFQFLRGELTEADLTPKQALVAKQIRTLSNITGKMAVKRGLMTQETYDANKDTYVAYFYLKHILDETSGGASSSSSKLGLAYQNQRKNLSIEKQRELGLIEDISVAAPAGIGRVLTDTAIHDTYLEIAENPNWVFQPYRIEVDGKKIGIGELVEEIKITEKMNRQAPNVPEIKARLDTLKASLEKAKALHNNAPQDFTQLPTSKKWGALSGAFVRKEIVRTLIQEGSQRSKASLSKTVNFVLEADAKLMATFKTLKTAVNIPTVTVNAISNLFQQRLGGLPFHKQPKNMLIVASHWKNRGAYLTKFKRNGGFRKNWSDAEITNIFDAVKTMQKENNVVKGIKKIAHLYGKIDDFYKFNMFIYRLRQGDTEAQAMIEAQKWAMDYTLVHPFIDASRKYAVPFASYPYLITSLIAEAAVKRPWVVASMLAIPHAMIAISKSKLNLSDDEFKELEKELPIYLKESGAYAPLPWRDKNGKLQWVNMERFFPWAALMNLGRDITEKKPFAIARDLGIGNPVLTVFSVLTTTVGDNPPKDPFTGFEIYNRLDSPTDKALKLSEWAYNQLAPSMLTRFGALGKAIRIGEVDKYGRETTAGQAASSLFGVNIASPTARQSSAQKGARVGELQRSLVKKLRDPTVSVEEKARARKEFVIRVKEIANGK